jgi:dihydropyrimidinase
MADDEMLLKVLAKARDCGMLVDVHAENGDVIDDRIDMFVRQGKLLPWYHYMSRPEFAEEEAVNRVLGLAKSVNAPLYIVHNAAKGSIEAIAQAKAHGQKVFAETCPQYLEFTNEVYKQPDAQNFILSPAIKGEESRAALWQALETGLIDTVATDHCPFSLEEKNLGKRNFTFAPNGAGGTEFLYPYILNAAGIGKISYSRAVQLCAENPARIFGCPDKGFLEPGFDADIVLYDPKKQETIHAKNMHGASDHTIYEGLKLKGAIIQTRLRGMLVYDQGKYVGKPGCGRYLKRGPSGCV